MAANYTQVVLNKNGSVTPSRQSSGAYRFPIQSVMDRNNGFLRLDPTTGQLYIGDQFNQYDRQGNLNTPNLLDPFGNITTKLNENKVDLVVGIIGVLLVVLALAQIAKPI